jgi:transcriptional regulator with GAF, ATPase, and Fis domain
LATVIDRAAILGEGKTLEVTKALGLVDTTPYQKPAEGARGQQPSDANQSLDQAMKQHIESVLRIAQGRIEGRRGAAARLEINPHTLRARMRKLGIKWQEFRPEGSSP